jgi:hypothetical protein
MTVHTAGGGMDMKKYILILIFIFIAINVFSENQPKLFGGEWEEVNVIIYQDKENWWTLECEIWDTMGMDTDRKIIMESTEKRKVIPLNDLLIQTTRETNGFSLYLTSDSSPIEMRLQLAYDHGKGHYTISGTQVFNPDGVNVVWIKYSGGY